MNGYGINESEAYDEDYDEDYDEAYYDEAYDDEAYDDEAYDEARRGKRRRPTMRIRPPVRTPSKRPSHQRPVPMPGKAVTRKEFTDALRNVDRKIGTNSKAIQMVDKRGRSLAAAQGRMAADLQREMMDRKKAILGVRKDLQQTRETSILLSLLTQLGIDGNSSIGTLAPLLLLGNDVSGEPSSSGTSGGILGGLGGGGGLSGIVPLLLISQLIQPTKQTT